MNNTPGFQGINICIRYLASHTHKAIFILIVIMTDQIKSYFRELEIKLNTTQTKIVYNSIKMRIMS